VKTACTVDTIEQKIQEAPYIAEKTHKQKDGWIEMETSTYEIDAPWDHVKLAFEDNLGMIEHFIKQLEYFVEAGVSQNPEATRQDIEGYKMVWVRGNQNLAGRFLERKSDARKKSGKMFIRNLDVIAAMKENGEWD
jgi:hypothetical protein